MFLHSSMKNDYTYNYFMLMLKPSHPVNTVAVVLLERPSRHPTGMGYERTIGLIFFGLVFRHNDRSGMPTGKAEQSLSMFHTRRILSTDPIYPSNGLINQFTKHHGVHYRRPHKVSSKRGKLFTRKWGKGDKVQPHSCDHNS